MPKNRHKIYAKITIVKTCKNIIFLRQQTDYFLREKIYDNPVIKYVLIKGQYIFKREKNH